jgi:hypothetical protein
VSRRRAWLFAATLPLFTFACAPRMVALPTGAGTPFPEAPAAYLQATERCRDVRTLVAVIAISGRVSGNRFRASVDAGFEAPASVRLELPAPGRSIFTFVAVGDKATLVLGRERRVMRDAPPAATLEALAGVALDPAELQSIVAGCGFGEAQAKSGRRFEGDWAALDTGETTSWLRQVQGTWKLAGATRGQLEIRYADDGTRGPATVRLRAPRTDLTLRLSQVDINEPLGPTAFQIEIPSDATSMTLEELRQAGPLGR